MSSHLSGSKRLAVIQRWINGHDDPDWEVLPTRKEGKYIVKKRLTPLTENYDESSEKVEETEETEDYEEKPKKAKSPKMKMPKPQKVPESQDPTVNLEILNQLKLLGEEIKQKREKKEQKRMIKEAIDKKITPPNQAYYQPQYQQPQYQQPQEQPPQQQQQLPPPPQMGPIYFRRRNRIFDDM